MSTGLNARPWPGVAILLLVLSGCAGDRGVQGVSASVAGKVVGQQEISTVPFFPQQDYQCGPAALATVLQAAGISVQPETLTEAVYLPERKGSLQIELTAAARSHGMVAYRLSADLDALIAEIDAGHPVLVLQNLGLDWWPQWHYAVVVGYDLGAGSLVLRSGTTRRHVIPLATFDRTWRRGGRWALVILPPGEIPATAKPLAYSQAVQDLALTGRSRAALDAFRAGAARWPRERISLLAWGNAEYAAGFLNQAEKAFRQVIFNHPAAANAWNNLAYVLTARDCRHEALQAVACAKMLAPADSNIEASVRELNQLSIGQSMGCRPVNCAAPAGQGIRQQ